jgi:hypothetical protein
MTLGSKPIADSETVRLSHLKQESAIKSIGQLCYLVAFFSLLGTIEFALFAVGVIPRDDLKNLMPASLLNLFFWSFAVGFAVNTMGQIALGYGLIRLQSWARWTIVVLTAMSLILGTISSLVVCVSPIVSAPLEELLGMKVNGLAVGLVSLIVGGAVHLLILWALLAPGTGLVFTRDYREVIRETPLIRSRMHWLLKLFVAGLMMLVVSFVAFLFAIYYGLIDW